MVCPRPLTEAVLVNIQPIHQVKRCPHPDKVKREKPSLFKMKKRGTQRVTLHYLLLLHVLCYVSTSQGQIFSKISTAKLTLHHLHTQMVAGGQGEACLSGKGTPAHSTGAPCVKGSLPKQKMKAKAFFLIFFFLMAVSGCN